jgi:hypothetical protein
MTARCLPLRTCDRFLIYWAADLRSSLVPEQRVFVARPARLYKFPGCLGSPRLAKSARTEFDASHAILGFFVLISRCGSPLCLKSHRQSSSLSFFRTKKECRTATGQFKAGFRRSRVPKKKYLRRMRLRCPARQRCFQMPPRDGTVIKRPSRARLRRTRRQNAAARQPELL